MSYTMTMDLPPKEASYLARHSAQFSRELSAIALVIVQSRMQDEDNSSQPSLDFIADWGRFKIQEGELDLTRRESHLREVDFG